MFPFSLLQEDPESKKRKNQALPGSNKKIKAEAIVAGLCDQSAITEALIAESKITNEKSTGKIQVRANHAIYIVHVGDGAWKSAQHAMVAGFGRGSFKLLKPDENAPHNGLVFRISDQDQLVLVGSEVKTVGDALAEVQESKPDAKICYHEMVPEDGDHTKFTCKQTHSVCFVPTASPDDKNGKDENKISVATIGQKEAPKHWEKCDALQILWACRWTTKGLQPVKPQVHLKGQLSLSTGQACKLSP